MGIRKGKFNIKADGCGMKTQLIFAFILAAASLNWACSGCSKTMPQANSPVSAFNKTAASPSPSQTSTPNTNPANSVTNAQTGTFANPPNNKKVVNSPTNETPSQLRFQPAAEDSEIASSMNSSGQMYSIRVFRNHPQLAKVESVWVNKKDKALKIFLKDGRVLEVTTDRILNLKQATTAQLLELVGIQPAQPERNKTGAKQAK